MFHVGQLVVCVDDVPVPGYFSFMGGLKKGKIYTIRGFATHEHELVYGVYLEEIFRPILAGDTYEAPFYTTRFRPVAETSLDVFREMLAPVPGVKQKECV